VFLIREELSEKLQDRYGKGFSTTNLKPFRSFYSAYPNRVAEISHPLGDVFEQKAIGTANSLPVL